MITKKTEKEKAILLRKQGKTYGEILKEVPVAKSTLSLWLREVGLSKPQVQRITEKKRASQLKGAKARRDERVRSSNEIFERSEKEVGIISPRELWLMGTMLYWAEGSKEKDWGHSQGVQFINSDSKMIVVFIRWLLDILYISPENIIFRISIHENSVNKIDEVKSFWSTVTGFPLECFDRVQYKRHNPKTIRKNIGNMYNGCLCISVKKSTNLLRQITGWTRGVYKQNIAGSYNGSTGAFEALNLGPIPSPAAKF